ncbi:MAG: hypothetical protein EXR62_18530 [Chloroflexi bacterium]|nr:hypothetical protein [Chloroflexota bacterium]
MARLMRRWLMRLLFVFAIAAGALFAFTMVGGASHGWELPAASISAQAAFPISNEVLEKDWSQAYLYVPKDLPNDRPARLVIALHGMGGNGKNFCVNLTRRADQEGWILLGPTFTYHDWKVVSSLRQDDVNYLPRIKGMVDSAAVRAGHSIMKGVYIYGFSRGAQMALRFSLVYPELVKRAAVFSGGTYTLPMAESPLEGAKVPLDFPFGVADLSHYFGRDFNVTKFRSVKFLVGVGANDDQPDDVPAVWTPYIGATRIERARTLFQALERLDVKAELLLIPGVHQETGEMRSKVLAFFAQP